MVTAGAFWVPVGVRVQAPGVRLPENWHIEWQEEDLDEIQLAGWPELKTKIIELFTERSRQREESKIVCNRVKEEAQMAA